jgi:hypothetical protein
VKWQQSLGTISQPAASVADLSEKAANSLGGGPSVLPEYRYCDNEQIKALYDLTLSLKRLVPATWHGLNESDWMYRFAYEIWSTDAIRGQFKPRHYPDESLNDLERRRRLGAKNTLPKVARHVGFLNALGEALSAFEPFESLEGFAALAGMISTGTTLGMTDGMLLGRIVKNARAQNQCNSKILGVLSGLNRKLEAITGAP